MKQRRYSVEGPVFLHYLAGYIDQRSLWVLGFHPRAGVLVRRSPLNDAVPKSASGRASLKRCGAKSGGIGVPPCSTHRRCETWADDSLVSQDRLWLHLSY